MSIEKRQSVAILFADISGYTALMQEDESGASKLLFKFQEALKEQVFKHNGKIINFYGDGCLAIFDSPTEAVKCAGSLQIVFQQNPKVPVRIGLHLGEVVFKEDNIYGDNVNLTSRIESIGVPGAVLFSEEIYLAIKNHAEFKIASLGRFSFKNIKQSVKVYALANKEFIVPRKNEIKGKLKQPNKSALAKATDKAKSALAVLGILTVLAVFNFPQLKDFFLRSFGETSLMDKRVAVLFFENETGDPSFDGVGKMAADWITQQLMNIEDTKVVLPSNVRNNIHLAKASMEGIQNFAKATGAEVIINGRYYQSGDNLILQSQVVNAQTGEVIHVLNQPIIGDKTDPLPLIQEVSQRITGYWAVQDRKQFADRPPKLLAYQEYLEGRKHWGIDFEKVEYHYQKAFALDSSFLVPIVELAASKISESDFYSADSLLKFLSQKSQYLSRAHHLQTKAYAAQLQGNLNQSLSYWEKIYEIDTKEFIALTNLSRQYLNTNQAQKALMILEQFDPSFLDFKECEPCQEYYELLTYAHFQLTDYQKVTSIVDEFNFDIKEGLIANYYLKSLIHQGNFDKAFDKLGLYLGEDLTFNGGRQSSGLLLVGLLFELQNMNQPDVAKVMANLLISYGKNNEQDWLRDYYLGMGHYAKKDFEDAADYFKKFYENYQQVPMILDLGLASLGACYVQLKEFEKLDVLYQELNDNHSLYAESYVAYAKAKIETQLGHRKKAIRLLKESKQLGQEFLWFKFQNDPFLEPLFEEPEFEDLVLR